MPSQLMAFRFCSTPHLPIFSRKIAKVKYYAHEAFTHLQEATKRFFDFSNTLSQGHDCFF